MKVCLITLDDVGFILLGNTPTPRIDSIRANGKNFTRFVAAPICSNFRAKVESGYYSPRPLNLTGGLYNQDTTVSLPLGAHTLGNCSVNTSQVGKWHLSEHALNAHRFQCGYTWFAGSQANIIKPDTYFDWRTVENGIPTQTQEYATDYVAQRAINRLTDGDPFVHVAFNVAHKPKHAPPGYADATFENMLAYADGPVGDVHDAAMEQGYLVILTSDGGGSFADGAKGDLSTLALNTFLCLSGPWPQTRPCDDVVDSTDLHATIWELVRGAPYPFTDGSPLTHPREYAFADRFAGVGTPPGPDWQEMATDGRLKLIRERATGNQWLTDWDDQPTNADPGPLIAALDSRNL